MFLFDLNARVIGCIDRKSSITVSRINAAAMYCAHSRVYANVSAEYYYFIKAYYSIEIKLRYKQSVIDTPYICTYSIVYYTIYADSMNYRLYIYTIRYGYDTLLYVAALTIIIYMKQTYMVMEQSKINQCIRPYWFWFALVYTYEYKDKYIHSAWLCDCTGAGHIFHPRPDPFNLKLV